jgi:hypothetical protein
MSADLFAPQLTRKLDPPAVYPGRRPFPWPVGMGAHLREYLGRHGGQWLKWEPVSERNAWETKAGRYEAMFLDGDGPFDACLTADNGFIIDTIPHESGGPEVQAFLAMMARAMPDRLPLEMLPELADLIRRHGGEWLRWDQDVAEMGHEQKWFTCYWMTMVSISIYSTRGLYTYRVKRGNVTVALGTGMEVDRRCDTLGEHLAKADHIVWGGQGVCNV